LGVTGDVAGVDAVVGDGTGVFEFVAVDDGVSGAATAGAGATVTAATSSAEFVSA
jgi:hypothetical protein